MTYADWLRDELPKVLEGTEHFKDSRVKWFDNHSDERHLNIEIDEVDIWVPLDGMPFFCLSISYVHADQAPIIIEACSLIQTIEAKRRELL